MSDMPHEALDWNGLWQQARKAASRKRKTPGDWDRRARDFARRTGESVYNARFISLLRPRYSWSILDVGSGPGNLAIPLAGLVRKVTALDYSPAMLSILLQKTAEAGLANISAVNLSWTDDWMQEGVDVHDAVIASRSLDVEDLRAALDKMNRYARRKAAIADRVGPGPFDPDAFRAVGRELRGGPDYIYTVNMLYQMGIRARVDFITLEDSHRYRSFPEALDSYTWMFSDLTGRESRRLEEYVRSIAVRDDEGTISLRPRHTTTWAFLHWCPQEGVAVC